MSKQFAINFELETKPFKLSIDVRQKNCDWDSSDQRMYFWDDIILGVYFKFFKIKFYKGCDYDYE